MARKGGGSGRSGNGDGEEGGWILLLLGGMVGYAVATQKSQPQPVDTKTLMKSMVQHYCTDNKIRAFVGRLFPPQTPLHPVAQIERIFRFVADQITYLGDPKGEFVGSPVDVLETRVGDCDCKATLLATLLEAAGFHTRFVFIPRHVYVEVGISTADRQSLPQGSVSREDHGKVWVPLESTGHGNPIGWIDRKAASEAYMSGEMKILDNRA